MSAAVLAPPLLSAPCLGRQVEPDLAQGPFVGHGEPHSARVWARVSAPGEYSLVVTDARGRETRATSVAADETDGCMVLEAVGLEPDTAYHYRIEPAGGKALGRAAIQGVTLIGGDIHRSRVVRHASADLAGYDLIELIVSPMHDGIIESANAPHPGLIKDMGEPRTILMLDASQRSGALESLRARFVNAAGDELFAIDLADEK